MKSKFEFSTDEEGYVYFDEVLNLMVNKYGADEEAALKAINSAFFGEVIDDQSMVFHREEDYWAIRLIKERINSDNSSSC
jgi:hypothetical protein